MQSNNVNLTRPEQLLRLGQVESLVGLRKSSIYEGMRRGTFPTPVKLSRRAVCWPASEIDAWIAEHIRNRARA
ncbi:MAG: AlpA family phage regulatory protein [Sphingobacteriales bacterium]|nr:MAG: AlpA family phage regulatory protein [Sphingobacteriales bacterium]